MAREKRKPKKDKKKVELVEAVVEEVTDESSEGEVPADGELKLIAEFYVEVPDPKMDEPTKEAVRVLLLRLQKGESLSLPHSRPMPSIGRRCHELRVTERDGIWRVFYRTDPDAIVVVYVLWKTTQQTPDAVIKLCKKRFKQYDAL